MPADGADKPTAAPSPRSPPKYPDFCGRRRLQLEVQILNREVGFLEEEVQSLEGLPPVSRCCKEVNEFVGTNPDPLIPLNKKRHKSCGIWRWLSSKLCCCFAWTCCCTGCSCQLKSLCSNCCPHQKNCSSCCCSCSDVSCCHLAQCCYCREASCCKPPSCCCSWKLSCCKPSCCKKPRCCRWSELCCCRPLRCCCGEVSCCRPTQCCSVPTFSCPEYSCGCVFDCPKCTEVRLCPKCSKPCCVTGCLC